MSLLGKRTVCLTTRPLRVPLPWQRSSIVLSRSLSFNQNPPPVPVRPSTISRLLPKALTPGPKSGASFMKLVALVKPERKQLGMAVGLLFISSSVSMSVPFTIGKLIDYFSTPNPSIILGLSPTLAAGGLLAVFTVGALANSGRVVLIRLAGQRIVARLREQTYASALRQEVEYVERKEGDVLSRLSVDASVVGESVTGNLSDGLRAVVTATVGVGLMYYTSPTLTLLMLALVPPVSLGAFAYGRYLKKLSNKSQEALGDMSRVAQEALSALRTVQASNASPMEEQKFSSKVSTVLDLGRKEALATAAFYGATGWSGNVTLLTLLGYGGTLVSKGAISVGDLTSLLLYTAYVGSSMGMLTSFFTSLMRGVGAGTRIFDLLERESLIEPEKGIQFDRSRRGTIRFDSVWFSYPTRKNVEILRGFTLDLGRGGSVALVGKSGSGKSSVQSLLLRFYDPQSGKITIDGQDIRDFTPSSWRASIGLVPQDPILFTGTIAENISYGSPNATRGEIEQAARMANCDFIWEFPDKFETSISKSSLSGGQRQRLSIARALLRKPTVLCLDEATAALDATSELRVNDAIDRILADRSTTCLIVAHRLSTIARAERIVVLEDGVITESGTYRELASRRDSRFRHLMAAQLDTVTQGQLPPLPAPEPTL